MTRETEKQEIRKDCFAYGEFPLITLDGRVIRKSYCICLDELYCAFEKCAFYKKSRKEKA